tara:strand:+ start:802 stop:981 length:180 start_codon:yes stop_codon:yes gene_type:complete
MIEITKNYKLTLNEEQGRQLYQLLQYGKDIGELNAGCRFNELRTFYNELKQLFNNGLYE